MHKRPLIKTAALQPRLDSNKRRRQNMQIQELRQKKIWRLYFDPLNASPERQVGRLTVRSALLSSNTTTSLPVIAYPNASDDVHAGTSALGAAVASLSFQFGVLGLKPRPEHNSKMNRSRQPIGLFSRGWPPPPPRGTKPLNSSTFESPRFQRVQLLAPSDTPSKLHVLPPSDDWNADSAISERLFSRHLDQAFVIGLAELAENMPLFEVAALQMLRFESDGGQGQTEALYYTDVPPPPLPEQDDDSIGTREGENGHASVQTPVQHSLAHVPGQLDIQHYPRGGRSNSGRGRLRTRSSQSSQGGTGTGNVMIDHSSAVMRTNTPMSQSPPGQVMEVSTHYSEAPDSCFRSIVARVSLVFIDRVSRVVV